jgi:hypothetical protein
MLQQSFYNNDGSERVFLCRSCAEECHRMYLEVGKKVKRVKRVMVDVISLVKHVVSYVP